jgi:hypothetical protein
MKYYNYINIVNYFYFYRVYILNIIILLRFLYQCIAGLYLIGFNTTINKQGRECVAAIKVIGMVVILKVNIFGYGWSTSLVMEHGLSEGLRFISIKSCLR